MAYKLLCSVSLQKQHSTSGGGDAVDAGAGVVVGAAADAARGGVEDARGAGEDTGEAATAAVGGRGGGDGMGGGNAPHPAAGGCPVVVRRLLASTPTSAFSLP